MKQLLSVMLLAFGLVVGPTALSSEATDAASHHLVKDSAITAKVKARLAAKRLSTLTRVKEGTDDDGVVWLSGRAPTQDASDLVSMIAKDTEGVNSVHNNIEVEP